MIATKQVQWDTKAFLGTWASATTVEFGPRSGEPDTVRLTLSDGLQRSVDANPVLTWAVANGIADLGYDEAASQGNSKWLYFYAVPATSDATQLTIVASDNAPSTGPTGRTAFKHVWSCYIDGSGNLPRINQIGDIFKYQIRQHAANLSSGTDGSPVQLSLATFIPSTAVAVELLVYYQAGGTAGQLIVWVSGQQGAGGDNSQWYTRAVVGDNTFGSDGVQAYVPTPGTKEVYYQRLVSTNIALISVLGWIDESVEG